MPLKTALYKWSNEDSWFLSCRSPSILHEWKQKTLWINQTLVLFCLQPSWMKTKTILNNSKHIDKVASHKIAYGQTLCNQGCRKLSAALALSLGSKWSIGTKKSANSLASFSLHSYFSIRTSTRPQGFNLLICRSSPDEQNKKILQITIAN